MKVHRTAKHCCIRIPGRACVECFVTCLRPLRNDHPLVKWHNIPGRCTKGGFGLWACLLDPKRVLGTHGVVLIGEVRLRCAALTPAPRGLGAGHTPPSAVVHVLCDGAPLFRPCHCTRGKRTYGGRPGQRVEEQGTWAAQKHSEAGDGRPVDRGVWTAKTVKRPRQQPAHPQYANYWAPLTRKRHTMPYLAQPQHANYWAPRTRKRHQQEHRPQRPTESSDPTQHAKGRTGDRPGPRKGATTRRNVTQGDLVSASFWHSGTGFHRRAPAPLPKPAPVPLRIPTCRPRLQSRMEQSIKQALEHHDKTAVGKISHSFVGLLEFSLLGGVHQADFHAAITDFERAKYATSRNKAELAALLVELRGAGTRYYEHLRAAGRQSPGEHAQKLAALAAVCQTRGEVDVFALYRLQHGTLNLQPGAAEGDRLEFLPTVPLATILDDPAGLRQRVDRWAETLFGHAVVPGPHSAPYHISSASPAAVAEGARMLRAVLAAGLAYSSGGANDVVPTLDRFRAALALQAPCEPARAPALRARLREVARMLRGGRRAGRRFSLSVNSDVGLCLVKLAGHHLDSWVGPEMEVVWRHMADAGQMCVFELWYHAPPDGAGPAPAPVLLAADFGHVVGDVVYVATRFYDRGYPKFGSGFLLALAECRVLQQRGFVWWDLGGVDRCPMMAYKRVLTRTIPRPEFLRESEGARAAAAPRALPQGTVVADITEEHLWSGVR